MFFPDGRRTHGRRRHRPPEGRSTECGVPTKDLKSSSLMLQAVHVPSSISRPSVRQKRFFCLSDPLQSCADISTQRTGYLGLRPYRVLHLFRNSQSGLSPKRFSVCGVKNAMHPNRVKPAQVEDGAKMSTESPQQGVQGRSWLARQSSALSNSFEWVDERFDAGFRARPKKLPQLEAMDKRRMSLYKHPISPARHIMAQFSGVGSRCKDLLRTATSAQCLCLQDLQVTTFQLLLTSLSSKQAQFFQLCFAVIWFGYVVPFTS